MDGEITQCEFCEKLKPTNKAQKRDWYDFNILIESQNFVAIPALGSIVPGYLLIVSKKHVPSMANLNSEHLHQLNYFYEKLALLQSEHWERPMVFEHGSCGKMNMSGSCIVHAHWHLVPGSFNLMPQSIQFNKVKSFMDFTERYDRKKGYLLFIDSNQNTFVSTAENVQSQIFRRELARKVGKVDEWDYLAYPFLENIDETINKLTIKEVFGK